VTVSIKVLHVGLGPIGAAVVRQVAARKGLSIVGAVDLDPAKVGLDVGDVCGLGKKLRVFVTGDLKAIIKATRPDVAILCTSSSLDAVVPEFEIVLKLKVPVVASTEELAYPVRRNARIAKRIDALAKRSRVAVLGTGVNPGFVMDALPIALTGVAERVDAIEIDRVQDARVRRLPFQQKIGAGLTRDAFDAGVKEGRIRHVGFAESISMIADAVGWKVDRITDEIQPMMVAAAVSSQFIHVEAGQVAGLIQDGAGFVKGKPRIKLHMEAYLGAPEAYDAVRIAGSPALSMRIAGGVHGDIATAAIICNSIPKVLQAAPGLRTMRDTILPSFFARA
jgi:4-hydroxy-tetrahydrodipicolinate reductase